MKKSNQAVALKVKGRYFVQLGLNKRLYTSGSLAFAKLFSKSRLPEIEAIETSLKAKGYKPSRVIIGELPVELLHKQTSIFDALKKCPVEGENCINPTACNEKGFCLRCD